MATSVPLSFKAQVPVTPPPDQHMFKGPFAPQLPRSDYSRAAYEASMKPPQDRPSMAVPPPTTQTTTTTTTPAPGGPLPNGAGSANNNLRDLAADPRYLAMASRIASYYQQRCQAVANFQQQRCQVWANAQRAKCQEMMQAAMLIVAWYIRDRISRRRRRQRRTFKRGLKQRCKADSRNKITKSESVRRWVMNVPLGATASPRAETNEEKPTLDKDEQNFEMDKEDQGQDKDSQLFNIADSMIKSQLARIDIPLLGVLSFDESDDEPDSEMDEEMEDDEEEDFEQGDEEMDEEYDDDDDGDADEGVSQEPEVDVAGSKSVHLGTSTKDSSRKRTKSSCIS